MEVGGFTPKQKQTDQNKAPIKATLAKEYTKNYSHDICARGEGGAGGGGKEAEEREEERGEGDSTARQHNTAQQTTRKAQHSKAQSRAANRAANRLYNPQP